MRRTRFLSCVIGLSALVSGALVLTSPGVHADTANPEVAYEGWFARNKPRPPQVQIPCSPTAPIPDPPIGCGPANPGEQNSPQAVEKGAYVVSSVGGNATDAKDPYGDVAWTTFMWDLFGYPGASIDKFVVTLTQAPDKRNDTYDTRIPGATPPPIQACNVATAWAAAAGSNPWEDRPRVDFTQCVTPTVDKDKFTFDLGSMAQSWIDGTGYGVAIVPGTPTTRTALQPFQITFSGYNTLVVPPEPVQPKVAFEFTPAPEDELFGGGGDGGGEEFFEETEEFGGGGEFAAVPELDVIPTDVGSEPLPEESAVGTPVQGETAAPETLPRTRPVSRDTGFPMLAWLLLPLALIAFWSTGTALGPLGDPVPARRGGVSRVLAQRQATHHSSPTDARY